MLNELIYQNVAPYLSDWLVPSLR